MKYEEIFNIRSYEVDFNNRLFVSSMFDYMQQAASFHADNLGFGFDNLAQKGLYWVLSRIDVEISNYPTYGGNVKVITWPKGAQKLFAFRDYILTDEEGNDICKATSAWILMDMNKDRPARVPKEFKMEVNDHAIKAIPDKIQVFEGIQSVSHHNVGYSDCDVNRHVNNVNYIRWIQNSFDEDFHNHNSVLRMQVNFLCECGMGHDIEIGKKQLADDKWYVEGYNQTLGQKAFQAILTI